MFIPSSIFQIPLANTLRIPWNVKFYSFVFTLEGTFNAFRGEMFNFVISNQNILYTERVSLPLFI